MPTARSRDLEKYRSFFKQLPSDLPNTVDELGKPLTLHKPNTIGMIAILLLGIVFFVLGVGIWGYYLVNVVQGTTTEVMTKVAVTAGSLAGIIGLAGIIAGFKDLRYRPVVVLFENGLVRVYNEKVTVAPWTDVVNVWETIIETFHHDLGPSTIEHKYTLELGDGTKLNFPGEDNMDEASVQRLGEQVQDAVTRARLPKLVTRLRKGKTIEFGALSVSEDGLFHRNSFLPWSDIEGLKMKWILRHSQSRQMVELGQSGGGGHTQSARIPGAGGDGPWRSRSGVVPECRLPGVRRKGVQVVPGLSLLRGIIQRSKRDEAEDG